MSTAIQPGADTSAEIVAERRGGRTAITEVRSGPLLRPRVLPDRDGMARVALVQCAAGLLGGDRQTVRVRVGRGARLEVIEVAATVCHHARGGDPSVLLTRAMVAEGALLVWAAEPLVLCAGADLVRRLRVHVAEGGAALIRDTLVVGRVGETGGRLRSRTAVDHRGRPLVRDGLVLDGNRPPARSSVVLGAARVYDQVLVAGVRPPVDGPDCMSLRGHGAMAVVLESAAAASQRRIGPVWRSWRERLVAPSAPVDATAAVTPTRGGRAPVVAPTMGR